MSSISVNICQICRNSCYPLTTFFFKFLSHNISAEKSCVRHMTFRPLQMKTFIRIVYISLSPIAPQTYNQYNKLRLSLSLLKASVYFTLSPATELWAFPEGGSDTPKEQRRRQVLYVGRPI